MTSQAIKAPGKGATEQGTASMPSVSMPLMSNFNYTQGADMASANGQGSMPQVYVDPETIMQQKESSISMIDSQAKIAKDRAKAEYDSQVQAVTMRAEIENNNACSAIEQAKYQALFALDQQHQQRKLEIEQRSQEQRLQIEATSSQLIMQAQQQRLQREMEEKLAKLQSNMPAQMFSQGGAPTTMFPTSHNLNGAGSYQYYNPYMMGGSTSYTTSVAGRGN
jgi:hypothetical protein